jgi:hypothetical protein
MSSPPARSPWITLSRAGHTVIILPRRTRAPLLRAWATSELLAPRTAVGAATNECEQLPGNYAYIRLVSPTFRFVGALLPPVCEPVKPFADVSEHLLGLGAVRRADHDADAVDGRHPPYCRTCYRECYGRVRSKE